METKAATTTLQTEIPSRLLEEVQALVQEGWAKSVEDVTVEALRRYVESHRGSLIEAFVREDVKWGLYGDD